ncbi:hypothetical protein F8S13_14080 [Chloroflexia bacterium SDU3-3]|nr:hypothetical protein F8S13_14080 [Chloroflexia bacterium SDU3-3]
MVQLLPDMPQVISAQWSPDGTKILAEVPTDVLYHNDCYLLDADGTMIRKIATIPAIFVYWTPDGSKIFYFTPDENLVGHLWVQPVDGSQAKQISPLDASGAIEFTYEWSPDGRYVAYDDHVNGLWVTDADGVIQYQSTATNTTRLVWSPDSSKLAYVTTAYDSAKLESSTLWSVDVASASLQQLAVHSELIRGNYDTWDEFPMWTDDSSTLVYLGSASNTLFAVPAAGGVAPSAIAQSVVLLIGKDADGSLLFSRQVGEQYTITRSRVDGSEAEDLALLDKPIQQASVAP